MSSSTPPSEPVRFPATSLTPSQQADLAAAEKAIRDNYGTTVKIRDEQGNLLGPFGPLSYTPTILSPYLAHVVAINTTPHLTARERELVILATTSVTRAEFVIDAHKKVGIVAGLTREQVDGAAKGEEVDGLDERERVVYQVGLEMSRRSGKVEDDGFEKAVGVLGREGVSALAQVVGLYFLAAVLVNVADVGATEG